MAELYEGIKFNYRNIGKSVSRHDLLLELKYWCGVFDEKKLAPPYPGGSSGNLSFRTKNGKNEFIITASHTALRKNMLNADFSEVVDYEEIQNVIIGRGEKEPSSEAVMHFLIYKHRKDVNAIFHGHSPDILKNATKLNLPVTEKELSYGTVKFAKNALFLLKKYDFIILKNHGFISVGETLEETGEKTILFLNKCKSI